MRNFIFSACSFVLAGIPIAQSFRPDWHSGDYPGRNATVWKVISEDLKTSFPRGGAPVEVKPFLQDDRAILNLSKEESNAPLALWRANKKPGAILQTRAGQFYFDGKSLSPISEKVEEKPVTFNGLMYSLADGHLQAQTESQPRPIPVREFG